MQPVRTLGLLALVRFLGVSEGPAGDEEGLLGLLAGSTLERAEYDASEAMARWCVVTSWVVGGQSVVSRGQS